MGATSKNDLWKHLLDQETLAALHLVRGVSIPFIVGVYYQRGWLNEADLQTSKCIKDVFDIIVHNIGNDFLIIEDCIQNEDIQGTYTEKILNNVNILILQRPQNDDNLNGRKDYRQKIYFPKPWDFCGSPILQLWEFYKDQISQKNFSWNTTPSQWVPFSTGSNAEVNEISIIQNL